MSSAIAEAPHDEPATARAAECLYCASTELVPMYTGVRDRLGHVAGERTFRRCKQCGAAVLDPLPKTEDLPGFYPPVYSFTLELGGPSRLQRMLRKAQHPFYFRP